MYDLSPEPLPCENCGELLERSVPYATGQIRGLKSKPHGCPSKYDHSNFRTLNKSDNDIIQSLFTIAKGIYD